MVSADAAPCARAPDAQARVRHILDSTSRYFGFDPADLAGLRLVLQGPLVSCSLASGTVNLLGCYEPGANTISVSTDGVGCLESTRLTHELLHYFIGDPDHTDPRWDTFVPLWQSLLDGVYCN